MMIKSWAFAWLFIIVKYKSTVFLKIRRNKSKVNQALTSLKTKEYSSKDDELLEEDQI